MELGKAYIQVIPSTKGIKGELTNELTGATAEAGSKGGQAFGAGFGKKAMTALKASGVATAGMVMAKGWSRMTAIDEAKAKLTALGHSVQEVQAISENANAAVKGTAYGMDAAMTAAASATAAGIQPGKELTRYLSLMGDAAAVAGVDMNEMGSIFNKVAANGKVTTEEMNQLADRGIPIWQLLAKETGMSMDELRSAIQGGEIDINDFQNAIETGMGGAAKTIGSTTLKGALSNIGASLSRIGANFLGSADDANSFAGKLLPLFNKLMKFMGTLENGAKVLGQAIGNILGPIMTGIGQVFTTLTKGSGSLGPLKTIILSISSILGKIIKAIFPLIIAGIKGIMKVIGPLLTAVVKIGSVMSSAFSKAVSAIQSAKAKIQSAINRIKSIVNGVRMKLGLKIPKIHISGGKAPWGIAGKGKLPSFSVTWAAQGGIVDGATLIGAGEAGQEAIVPLDPFWRKLDEKTAIDYELLGNAVANAISRAGIETVVQLDSKTIARGIARPVQSELNRLQSRDGRKLGYA